MNIFTRALNTSFCLSCWNECSLLPIVVSSWRRNPVVDPFNWGLSVCESGRLVNGVFCWPRGVCPSLSLLLLPSFSSSPSSSLMTGKMTFNLDDEDFSASLFSRMFAVVFVNISTLGVRMSFSALTWWKDAGIFSWNSWFIISWKELKFSTAKLLSSLEFSNAELELSK